MSKPEYTMLSSPVKLKVTLDVYNGYEVDKKQKTIHIWVGNFREGGDKKFKLSNPQYKDYLKLAHVSHLDFDEEIQKIENFAGVVVKEVSLKKQAINDLLGKLESLKSESILRMPEKIEEIKKDIHKLKIMI